MPEPAIVLGIDPGLDGAIAAVHRDGRALEAIPLPTLGQGRRELDAALLARWVRGFAVRLAVLEAVHSMPKQGVAGVFSFGCTYGMIRGVLATLHIPVELVTPQRWKREVLAGTDRSKAAAVAYAQRRFPGVDLVPRGCRKPHEGMAEALCLAEFGRRLVAGEGRESA